VLFASRDSDFDEYHRADRPNGSHGANRAEWGADWADGHHRADGAIRNRADGANRVDRPNGAERRADRADRPIR